MILELPKPQPPQHDRIARITVEQYHRMIETGIVTEGAPIELWDGILVWKDRSARGEDPMAVGNRHRTCVKRLMDFAALIKSAGAELYCQAPLTMPSLREPEPDGYIARGSVADYQNRHPNNEDAVCAIEVSDRSLEYDRTVKLQGYASAGIPQYIIINIPDNQIEVYEQPVPAEGRYAQSTIVKSGQNVGLRVGEQQRLEVPAASLLP